MGCSSNQPITQSINKEIILKRNLTKIENPENLKGNKEKLATLNTYPQTKISKGTTKVGKVNTQEDSNNDTETFTKIRKIGDTNNSYLIKSIKTFEVYAYKKVDISNANDEETKKILKEVEILKVLNHPNIIGLYEYNISEDKNNIEIVYEFADDGDLQMKLDEHKKNNENFNENQLLEWLVQICLALRDMHNHGEQKVLHRNIKPSNIFLMKKDFAKLGDFGMSKIIQNKFQFKRSKTILKLEYYAPEIIEKRGFSEKSDIWYLGVTFFMLMTFCFPFKGETEEEKKENILKENKNEYNYSYDKNFKELINKMLSKDENNRPSAEEILDMSFMKTRMEFYLTENNFKFFNIADSIKNYEEEEEKTIKKKRKSIIKIVDNDKNSNVDNNNKKAENKRAKKIAYDFGRQLLIMNKLIKGK